MSNKSNEFDVPSLTPFSLDTFIIRTGLFAAVKRASNLFSGTLIDVGCGQMPYREFILAEGKVDRYIGLDLEHNDLYLTKPDVSWNGITIPLAENSVDCALTTEVLEHCSDPAGVLREIFKILRPGGVLFLTVPFLWPLHDVPHDHYRFTPYSLARHLEDAGFENVELQPLGGWDDSLAQMIGLYVRRRPMPRYVNALLSFLVWPVMYLYVRLQRKFCTGRIRAEWKEEFPERFMFTGVSGTAYKPKALESGKPGQDNGEIP